MAKGANKGVEKGQEDEQNSRVTVTLRYVDRKRVDEIADAESVNRNDAIRLALATEQFVSRVRREGGKFLIKDKDGEIREVEFVR
jgi:hypothetical protein